MPYSWESHGRVDRKKFLHSDPRQTSILLFSQPLTHSLRTTTSLYCHKDGRRLIYGTVSQTGYVAMKTVYKTRTTLPYREVFTNTPFLLAVGSGLALLAGVSVLYIKQRANKRYGDHALERRTPANMFAAGVFPLRRQIDRSGRRPLFERRQSTY
jgi:hypothetical protein